MTTSTRGLPELFFNNFFDEDFTPTNDILENEDEFKVELMLPAFKKKDFNIRIEKNKLIVEGERKRNEENKYNVMESYFGTFKKSYILPDFADKDSIDARYKDGVLSVVIPKSKEKLKKRLVEVK